MERSTVPVDIVDSTPSTMDEARERVHSGHFRFDDPMVACACVMAREQTAGRGQRGRTWFAPRDESLCATYMLSCRGVTHPAASGHLALLAGVAVAGALALKGIEHKFIGLKWPNDILLKRSHARAPAASDNLCPPPELGVGGRRGNSPPEWGAGGRDLLNGRKVGGILVEMMKSPAGTWVALVGVGLNVSVREFPSDLAASATSLLLEGVEPEALPGLEDLARDVGDSLGSWALRCRTMPESVIHMWRRFDATTGRRYETAWNGTPVFGTAQGIDDEGALLLRLDDGTPAAVTSATSIREIDARSDH